MVALPELIALYTLAGGLALGYGLGLRRLRGGDSKTVEGGAAFSWATKIFLGALLLGFIAYQVFFLLSPDGLVFTFGRALGPTVERIELWEKATGSLSSAIFLSNTIVALLAAFLPLLLGALDSTFRRNRVYGTATRILSTPVDLVYRVASKSARMMSKDHRLISLAVLAYPFVVLSVNGFLIGLLAAAASLAQNPVFFAIGVIPHGVIEIPAILLAASLGYAYARRWTPTGEEPLSFLAFATRLIRGRRFWATVLFIIAELSIAAYVEAEFTFGLLASLDPEPSFLRP